MNQISCISRASWLFLHPSQQPQLVYLVPLIPRRSAYAQVTDTQNQELQKWSILISFQKEKDAEHSSLILQAMFLKMYSAIQQHASALFSWTLDRILFIYSATVEKSMNLSLQQSKYTIFIYSINNIHQHCLVMYIPHSAKR